VTTLSTEPRRLHPLSPLTRIWGVLVVVLLFGVRDGSAPDVDTGDLGFIAPIALGIGAIVLIGAYLSWWRTAFSFDADGDLRITSGILERRERRVQLSRLQAVDLVRPLAARVLGLGEVRIEVAGGQQSHVSLSYLSHDDAIAMRAELLARAAGLRAEPDGTSGEPAAEAPESTLLVVPTDQLVLSTLLGVPAIVGAVGLVGLLAVVAVTRDFALGFGVVFVVLGPLAIAVATVTNYFGFTLAESPDGLRTRRGLLETRAQTIPPGRVQAVGLSQSLLWRRRGWVKVSVDVAGVSGDEQNEGATVLMPVMPEHLAFDLLAHVLPGFDPRGVPLTPAPRRARRRAPITWSALSAGLGDTVVVTRSGRFTRRLTVAQYARVQSVRLTQGPWERSLDLATVHVDTAGGPVAVVAAHRESREARAWTEDLARRADAARRTAP
jgi:putative membrane protein